LKNFSGFDFFSKKGLDNRFSVVLKLSTASNGKQFFTEIILMSQSWIHTNETFKGSAAILGMRCGSGLNAALCAGFEPTNYQPKTGGLDRLGRKS
jgi:hypothetical protein